MRKLEALQGHLTAPDEDGGSLRQTTIAAVAAAAVGEAAAGITAAAAGASLSLILRKRIVGKCNHAPGHIEAATLTASAHSAHAAVSPPIQSGAGGALRTTCSAATTTTGAAPSAGVAAASVAAVVVGEPSAVGDTSPHRRTSRDHRARSDNGSRGAGECRSGSCEASAGAYRDGPRATAVVNHDGVAAFTTLAAIAANGLVAADRAAGDGQSAAGKIQAGTLGTATTLPTAADLLSGAVGPRRPCTADDLVIADRAVHDHQGAVGVNAAAERAAARTGLGSIARDGYRVELDGSAVIEQSAAACIGSAEAAPIRGQAAGDGQVREGRLHCPDHFKDATAAGGVDDALASALNREREVDPGEGQFATVGRR